MDSADRYDVIVIGVGAVGSAATYHLAKHGVSVLGIERYDIPHGKGSSRGITRALNPALRERPEYVPIAQRAITLWEELQADHDHQLLNKSGAIRGWPSSDYVGYRGTLDDAIEACEAHSLSCEVLTGSEIKERYPAYDFPDKYRFLLLPDGGVLDPQECIIAHTNQAHAHGGTIRARERVLEWEPTHDGVIVRTDRDEYQADQLVVTAGAWLSSIITQVEDVTAGRADMGWFHPKKPDQFTAERFPSFGIDTEEGYFYGTPGHRLNGVKVGGTSNIENPTPVDPDKLDRSISADDETEIRQFLEEYLPNAAGPTLRMSTCMTTSASDKQYIIDTHPDYPEVHVAGAFSGSGFTTASAVGEIISDLVLEGATSFDISPFDIGRFWASS